MLRSTVTTLLLVAALAAVASLLVGLRRAQDVERRQLKWFCYAAGLFAAAAFVAVALPSVGGYTADTVSIMLGMTALPVAIGIAVLRYRLYDIDRLINRTLVYGLLTSLLAGVYAAWSWSSASCSAASAASHQAGR